MVEEPRPQVATNNTIEYRFAGVTVGKFSAVELPNPGPKGTHELSFHVQMDFGIALVPAPTLIVSSTVTCRIQEPAMQVCELTTHIGFEVVGGFDRFKDEEGSIRLPDPVMGMFIQTALGTTRGILFAKNFGTSFANVLLPPMNVQDLMPKEPFKTAPDSAPEIALPVV